MANNSPLSVEFTKARRVADTNNWHQISMDFGQQLKTLKAVSCPVLILPAGKLFPVVHPDSVLEKAHHCAENAPFDLP